MRKLSHKLLALTAALIVVLSYLGLRYFLRHFRTEGGGPPVLTALTEEERAKEKASRVQFWLSQPTVPLLSPELDASVSAVLDTESCLRVPAIGKPIPLRTLSAAEVNDLKEAVKGLLQAYAKSDPEALFAYMEARKERLSPGNVEWGRTDMVQKHRMSRSMVSSYSDKRIFTHLWTKALKCQSHWRALVANSGCARIWQTDKGLDDETILALGREDNEVFWNMVRTAHAFVPISATMESTLDKDGIIRFADVKVVIQYDEGRLNEPRPHYIRFWFDPVDNIWHPLDFVEVPAVDQTYPVLLF